MSQLFRGINPTIVSAVFFAASLSLSPVHAATLADVTLPDQATVNGATLVLNGLGVRRATFLKVPVYVIGLYLEQKSSDAKAIIESNASKRIQMNFVHKVTADELRDGWQEGFDSNYEDVASIQGEIAKFNASMRDVKVGDTLVLDVSGDTVGVLINGSRIDTVEGKPFREALVSIWLGAKPPNDDLKEGILGR